MEKGATTFVLDSEPEGWGPNDTMVLTNSFLSKEPVTLTVVGMSEDARTLEFLEPLESQSR